MRRNEQTGRALVLLLGCFATRFSARMHVRYVQREISGPPEHQTYSPARAAASPPRPIHLRPAARRREHSSVA